MNLYQKILYGTVVFSGLTDLLRKISLGGITPLGLFTILIAFVSCILPFTRKNLPSIAWRALYLVLFIVCSLMNVVWFVQSTNLPIILTIQNLSVYMAFVGLLILSIQETNRYFESPDYITNALTISIKLSVVIYGVSILIGGPGTDVLMAARGFGLFGMMGVAWLLAGWRYGVPGAKNWTIITLIVVSLSNSRTALVIALLLFPLSQISLKDIRSWFRIALIIILTVIVSYLAFTYVEPIRARFTDVGDNATVGGVQINTSGRGEAWPVAYESAWESPWFGKGPGSVSVLLVKSVGHAFLHPHNDYLRIFHDFGLIGLTLWLLGYIGLIIKTWQYWHWADENDRDNAHIHLAAFLGLIAAALGMITDNVIVYIFLMGPLGILVGASIGNGNRRKRIIRTAHKLALLSDKF